MRVNRSKENRNIRRTIFYSFLVYFILTVLTFLFFLFGIDRIKKYIIHEITQVSNDYSRLVEISNLASNQFRDMLDDTLISSVEIVNKTSETINYEDIDLYEVARLTNVDNLYIYNSDGIIINATDEEDLGWHAPETHDTQKLLKSSDRILKAPIRKAPGFENYNKYAYLKTDDRHVIQSSISANKIHSFIDKLNPNNVIESLKTKEAYIIDAEIYFKDKQTVNDIFGVFELEEGQFNFKALDDRQVNFEELILDEHHILKIHQPIFFEDEHIGDLYIYRSFDLFDNLKTAITLFIGITFGLYITTVLVLMIINVKKQRRLNHLSIYNPDTGLYSRHYLSEYIKENFKNLINNTYSASVILISNYHKLNLFLDEETAQKLEKQFINLTLQAVPKNSMVFRHSDDVLVVFSDSRISKSTRLQEVKAYLDKIEAFNFHDHKVDVKVGIIELDERYSASRIIENNMTSVISELRKNISDNYIIFDDVIWDQIAFNEGIQNDLIRAFATGFEKEFFLVQQPKLNVLTNKVVGFESLLRWKHPKLGLVSPAIFIPLAEEISVIHPLSDFVIDEAIKFAQKIIQNGFEDIVVSFNVTYLQFNEDIFTEALINKVRNANLKPQNFALEITESIMIDNFKMVNEKLTQLKNVGFSIYLDDLGIGYSSLVRIKDMVIDVIKVDRSFIELFNKDMHLLNSLFTLLENLDFKTIIEGVETKEQLDWLTDKGYYYIQGFYLSKPLSSDDALDFIKNLNLK